MVGHDTVDLLRHGPVKTPQARFHMAYFDVQLGSRQGSCKHGVGITLHQHHIRCVLHEDLLYASKHLTGLCTVQAGAHVQVVFCRRKFKLLKEYPVHLVAIMLAGMENVIFNTTAFTFPNNRTHFDDFRTGTQDDRYLQFISSLYSDNYTFPLLLILQNPGIHVCMKLHGSSAIRPCFSRTWRLKLE